MLKNSSLYNPVRRPELMLERRNTVLGQMAKYDFISEAERDSLQALKMDINFNPESHQEGLATYFRMYLQRYMNVWIDKNPKPALKGERSRWNLYLDGLKIYTTIDSRMQKNAEEAVARHMKNLQKEFFHQNTPATEPHRTFCRSGKIRDRCHYGTRHEKFKTLAYHEGGRRTDEKDNPGLLQQRRPK